jgi:putative phosphoesterase
VAQEPDAILHAGDIGDLSVLGELRKLAPTFAVRGNIDGRRADLPDVLEIGLTRAPDIEPPLLDILLLHIGLNGPKLRADAARLVTRHASKLLICGHSHVPFIGRDRGVALFNPGSIGPRRFNLPIVFGVLDLTASGLRLWHVDCETGERWTPP